MCNHLLNHQLIIIKFVIIAISTPIKVLEKGILPLELNSIAIQFFLDLENEDKTNPCMLHTYPKKCCLIMDKEDMDCDSMKLHGDYLDVLKASDRKTFMYIYLTLAQINLQGFCDIALNHRCRTHSNKSEQIKIPFDTRLNKRNHHLLKNFKRQQITHCLNPDEDPIKFCTPVNCDMKYSGTKPFYDKKYDKCIEAAKCETDLTKDLPDIVYDPISNTCKDLDHALTVADIYSINTGLGVIVASDVTTEVPKVPYQPNCSTISQNMLFLKDMLYGKLGPAKGYDLDFTTSCNMAILQILYYIMGLSSLLIAFVCCTQAWLWLFTEWKKGRFSKKGNDMNSKQKVEGNFDVRQSFVNKDVTNNLLKEVIVSDLPLELQDSVVDICERIGNEVRWKKRYRLIDVGSQINLKQLDDTSDTSTTSDLGTSEKDRLLNKR